MTLLPETCALPALDSLYQYNKPFFNVYIDFITDEDNYNGSPLLYHR